MGRRRPGRGDEKISSTTPQPKDTDGVESAFRKRDWPFYWITRTSARYFMKMEARLKPAGLDVPRWRILMTLYEGGYVSITEIADLCIIKLNTTTKIIQRMAADGLVETRQRPTDGRVTEVTLTPKGDEMRVLARDIAEQVFDVAFKDLTPEEQRVLNVFLERVFNRLGEF